jgi:chromosome segregation ATPase
MAGYVAVRDQGDRAKALLTSRTELYAGLHATLRRLPEVEERLADAQQAYLDMEQQVAIKQLNLDRVESLLARADDEKARERAQDQRDLKEKARTIAALEKRVVQLEKKENSLTDSLQLAKERFEEEKNVRIGLEENSERLRSDNAELRAELAQYEMKKKKKKGKKK